MTLEMTRDHEHRRRPWEVVWGDQHQKRDGTHTSTGFQLKNSVVFRETEGNRDVIIKA